MLIQEKGEEVYIELFKRKKHQYQTEIDDIISRREISHRGSRYYSIRSKYEPDENVKTFDADEKKRRNERLERERIRREQECREMSMVRYEIRRPVELMEIRLNKLMAIYE